MIGRMPGGRRGLGLALQVLVLLLPLGLGGFLAGRHLWAYYHFRAGKDALQRRAFAQAQSHLDRSLEIWSNSAQTHFLAARAARSAGALEDARRHLEACDRLGGGGQEVALEWDLWRAQSGALNAAVEQQLWKRIERGHEDTPLILEVLARAYLFTYRLSNALECLERWLEDEPENAEALALRGTAWQGLRHTEAALADYREAVALDPAQDEARLRLADLLLAGRPREALGHFRQLRERQPDNRDVLLGLARCLIALDDVEEARQLLDDLLAQRPDDAQALTERGRIALHAGLATEAEIWLRQSVAADPHDQESLYLLQQCLLRTGKKGEAAVYEAKGKQIEADLKRLDELNRLVAEAPGNAALRHEAGTLCLRHGQDQEALRWFSGALQQDPRHRPTHRALAEYYQRADRPRMAEHHRRLAQ